MVDLCGSSMGDKWTFECRPYPGVPFPDNAAVQCVGAPVSLRDKVIGHVTSYRIEDGELVLVVDQD